MEPIRRAVELQPLSRQHHNGLLFCLFLEKGIKKQADKILMRDFCMYFWQEDLQHHFEIEEKYLAPFVSYPALKEVIDKMVNDHLVIRNFFERSDVLTEYSIFDQLQQMLEAHIRFEEREVFNLIQLTLSPKELHELGHVYENESNNICAEYPIKFWE